MTYKHTIKLHSEEPIEVEFLIALNEILEKQGITVSLFDEKWHAIQEAKKLLQEKGASYLLSLIEVSEAVLPKVTFDERPLLIKIISDQLVNLMPQSNIIIIDPYIFPNIAHPQTYTNLFYSIINSVINQVQSITFITKANHSIDTRNEIENLLKSLNSKIIIKFHVTEDYHDRFWIVDNKKGIFIGTSLNGIGNRYALTDYMKEEDVLVITKELARHSFLD